MPVVKRSLRKETPALPRGKGEQVNHVGQSAGVVALTEEPSSKKSKAEDLDEDFSSPTNSTSDADARNLSACAHGALQADETADNADRDAALDGVALIRRSNSASSHLPLDNHMKRRIMGAAATLGGTAGMLAVGPVTGVALGATAAYVATREDAAGKLTRKTGAAYVRAVDRATDAYIKAADRAIDEGRHHLAKELASVATSSSLSVPVPVRASLRRLSTHLQPAVQCGSSALREEAERMLAKYPDRVPVVCAKSLYSDLPQMEKTKLAVPGSMPCGEFKYIVHKNVVQATGENLRAEQTIYIFVNGVVPKTTTPMSELYAKFQGDDGFLHVTYGAENTLG